eukprot:UN13775
MNLRRPKTKNMGHSSNLQSKDIFFTKSSSVDLVILITFHN